jgi:geranylgeranyl pyrophosphate synthase
VIPGKALDAFAAEAAVACGVLRDAATPAWPELRDVVEAALAGPPPPLAALPLATCVAAGGRAEHAIPGAAAWLALNLSLRIYDDVMDEDRPEALWATLGRDRAIVVAGAVRELATLVLTRACSAELATAQLHDISSSLVGVGSGQDRDLAGASDLASWWQVMSRKSGQLFALACRIGARFGSAATAIDPLGRYGHAVGMAFQLADDWSSTAATPDARDLAIGKRTTPIWLALAMAPPALRARLKALLAAGPPWDAVTIGQLLDEAGARPYTLWLAHRMADRAQDALTGVAAERARFLVELVRTPLAPLPAVGPAADAPAWLLQQP